MDKGQFHAMASNFSEEDLRLLLRKRVYNIYPYEFMDNVEKLKVPLPKKEEFYRSWNDENVSDADYEHAQNVYAHFGHQNMEDYHDLYLKTDVFLLVDVFEGFRRFSLDKYGLDPRHYLTTPSLAWDAGLKMTKVELERLDDVDKYLFCESGVRGGISMISRRHASANNPGVPGYDESKPHTHIMYWDANNRYGWTMVQKLSVDRFLWLDDEERKQDLENIDAEGAKGYIWEVDLEYPAELQDTLDKYPLAIETMDITSASPYCEQLKEAMGIKVPPQRKLVPSLLSRKKYILHFRNLKLNLQLGMRLVKMQRGLQFNQKAWMEPYIMFNTRMRALATSDFDKNLLNLFNNAVFEKTMENVRKYKNTETMDITSASPYCEQLKEAMGIKVPPQRKLVPSLQSRKKYILHFRNLKLYLQLGMRLVKVQRGLQFNQKAWMEPYIMFNTRMRALATSDFDKNLLKLFNNAVFEITIENVRKYNNTELVTSEVVFEKRVANHRYKRSCRFNENLVGVAMVRPSTCLCKPIYCGLTVLDLSNELMYRFNYEDIIPKYGPRATLL